MLVISGSVLSPMALDKAPIRLDAETGLVADMDVPVAQFRMLLKEAIRQRIRVLAAMRLDPEGAARQRQYQMAVDLRCGMRCDDYAVLLGQRRDPQCLRKAG